MAHRSHAEVRVIRVPNEGGRARQIIALLQVAAAETLTTAVAKGAHCWKSALLSRVIARD
jgi:hypothetical protein